MGTLPQPPRPPAAPAAPPPPRSGSNVLAIVLLVLALIIVVSALSVWVGLRFLSNTVKIHTEENASGKKEVSIKTPVGSFGVATDKDVSEASLGLPIYPGATRLQDKGSVSLNFDFPGDEGVRVRVAKFETSDSLEKVKDFYKDRLANEVTKFTQKTAAGKTAFEMKHDGQEKVVALSPRGSGTLIELVRVQENKEGTN